MTPMTTEEKGLANTLAATTDQNRAEILANEEGGKAPEVKKETDEIDVKATMAKDENETKIRNAFGKVHSAVRAAEQSACGVIKAKGGEPEALFTEAMGELMPILEEMADDGNIFKQMAKEVQALHPY